MRNLSLCACLAMTGALAGPALADRPFVKVATLEELYAAVNDPANAGAVVELAARVYVLDASLSPATGGRLLLQPGMDLVGQQTYRDSDGDGVWDPIDRNGNGAIDAGERDDFIVSGETKLDARNLAPTSVDVPDLNSLETTGLPTNWFAFNPAVVEVGRHNRVARLTVSDYSTPTRAQGNNCIAPPQYRPELAVGDGWRSEIVDNILEGGRRGTLHSNLGEGSEGFTSVITFERNIVRYNDGGVFFVNFNTDRADSGIGPSNHGVFRANRFYGNTTGLAVHAGAYGTDNAESHVLSVGNVLDGNTTGFVLRGGSHLGSRSGANGNRLWFTSHGDTIRDAATSLLAIGGERSSLTSGRCSDNQLRLVLNGTRFERSRVNDVFMVAARGQNGVTDPGAGNVVEVLVRNATSDATSPSAFLVMDRTPASAPASNQVIVRGSSLAFEQTNALDSPGDEFFSPGF